MENIPQPADTPYTVGDEVRVYVEEDDVDSRFHGLVCEVVDDIPDDFNKESGRALDKHHYELRRSNTNEILPISFRHFDLVPAEEWPNRE